jgi:glycosyltransferase involved in cell wall biosynthesis
VPVRIAHSHLDIRGLATGQARRRYLALMKYWIGRHATVGFAASHNAAASLFGAGWARDPRWRALHCGIDLAPFVAPVDGRAVRAELGIAPDALVVGHVGRFVAQKNHAQLLAVLAAAVPAAPNLQLLLVGDGPLRPVIERQALELGVADRVIFAGLRTDIPRLLHGAVDVFVFPSWFEGLGLALVEAQAAGLPCVLADTVPPEADVVGPLMQRLSLDQPAAAWATAVLAAHRSRPGISSAAALALVQTSSFNLETGVAALTAVYRPMEGSIPCA